MDTIKIRHKIIKSIRNVSDEELEDLYTYISKLEKKSRGHNDQLKFSGAWKDIDDGIFENFTYRIIERRKSSKRRFN